MITNLKTESVSIAELTNTVKENYADEFEASGVHFIVENLCREKDAVNLDMQKFKRVLSNIYSNSLKHMKKDEKIIKTVFSSDRKMFYVNIADNGDGVSEDKLEMIFEPLYTSDEGRKVAGLGLANCREIISAHNGNIYARSSESGGLEICIEIPRQKL